MKKYLTREAVFGIALCITIALVLGDLAFSVRTYHDNIVAVLLIIWFIYFVICELKKDKLKVITRVKEVFYSSKWLLISMLLYFLYDLITIIYAKNYTHALKKLPYLFEYMSLFLIGIYYCSTKKRIIWVMSTIGATGIIVAIGSYIYHAAFMQPIYFQRLSTARDYNVYACLLFFCFVFVAHLIIHEFKFSFLKRILIYTVLTILVVPSFYFSGSRRMFIMLPYMLLFTLIYEGIRLRDKLPKTLLFISITVAVYLGTASLLPVFTEYGLQKETVYKTWVKEQQDTGVVITKPPNSWNETTIESIIQTIDDKSMTNKRSLIYKTAISELLRYKPVELIFGRGGAYDIHLYDVTTDKDILEAYSILEYNERPIGWMSVHNFMLADILNGGLIKLALGIFLIVQVVIRIIKAIKVKPQIGPIFLILFSLVIINNFISGTYGMLNDIFFYMIVMLIISTTKESLNEQKSLHNDECPST